MSALWELCRPFWGGWRSWRAWSLLAVAVSMGFGIVYLNVQINEWSRVFYDTLSTYDSSKLFGLMKEYTVYILLYIGVFVYQDWFTSLLVIRWRSALTAQFVDGWLAKRTFYSMSLTGKIDNPDQRIAEDINLFTDKLVSMVAAFIINAGRLSSFMIILWQLSSVQRFTLFGREWAISCYLVCVVIIYTVVGTLITHLVGKKLHGISYARQRSEADFRAALLRKHDNAEQIALYGGEAQEKTYLARHVSDVARSWRQLMDAKRNMGFFTSGYMRVSLIVPIFAALPAFLSKTVTLCGLMQIRSAFA